MEVSGAPVRHDVGTFERRRGERAISSSVDIQAVDRVGRILALFGPDRETVSSAEAADLIGLNRTTTYRYLASLTAAGILEVKPDRTYGPGPTLIQLGSFALGRQNILDVAPEPMSALAQTTRITAVLSLWGASSPVVAHVEESSQREIVVTVRVGMHLRSQAAQAIVFQAFRSGDPRVRRALRALPDEEREVVEGQVESVRERGFSGQVSPRGIAVLAVPVYDDQHMVASLGLLSTRDVLDVTGDSAELAELRRTADAISFAMGRR